MFLNVIIGLIAHFIFIFSFLYENLNFQRISYNIIVYLN